MANISRRTFLEGSVAGAALLAGTARAEESKLPNWNMETDVLVVGGGYGGLPAAVKAARLGKRVIVIDKRL